MMRDALLGGILTFAACWLVHLGVWRIRIPKGYLVWLPVIFWILPLCAVPLILRSFAPLTEAGRFSLALATLLHFAISCCYICGYAGVTEYSPSAELLLAVREHMPRGVARSELRVRSFTEQSLTGGRIDHLLASRVVSAREGRLRVTRLGQALVASSRAYRILIGVEETGRG